MRHYPKKYYSKKNDNIHSPISGDCLFSTSLSVNNVDTNMFYNLLQLQLYCSYLPIHNPVVSLFLNRDTFTDRIQEQKQPAAMHAADCKKISKNIVSWWLVDNHMHISQAYDIMMHYQINTCMKKLIDTHILAPEKVCYYWDFDAGCSIDATQVSLVPRPSKIHRIRCFVDGKKDSVILYLSELHLLFGIVAIAVSPEDRRYRKMIGKKIIIPIINKIVPIVWDDVVVPTVFNGIKPIIPAHDPLSLAVAHRHNLPCDIYAVDAYGVFQEHAGIYQSKYYRDFIENIIQYLQEIHNYDWVEDAVLDVPFCQKTDRYLWYFSQDGRVLRTAQFSQHMLDYINSSSFVASVEQKQDIVAGIERVDDIVVSQSHGTVWIAQIGKDFYTIDTIASIAPTGKYRGLFIMIVDMLCQGILSYDFTIEDCIDSWFGDQKLYMHYIQLLKSLYGKKSTWKNDIESLNKVLEEITQSDASAMDVLVDMLDDAPFLIKHRHRYCLSPEVTLSHHGFVSSLFLSASLSYVLAVSWSWSGASRFALYDNHFVSFFCLSYVLDSVFDRSCSWYILPDTTYNISEASFDKTCVEPLRYHSSDTMRLALIKQQIHDLQAHELIVQKIWNVCRYVYMEVLAKWSLSVVWDDSLIEYMARDIHQLTVFDQWILYVFFDMADKLREVNDITFPLQYRIDMLYTAIVEDFSIKYISVVKKMAWPMSHAVMIICISMIYKMLAPLFPQMMEQVHQLFGSSLIKSITLTDLRLPSKNYKIHLLMSIVGSLVKMKSKLLLKNHQQVDVCIQWSTDMIDFLNQHRPILDIVNIHTFSCIGMDKDIDSSYMQENIIDIVLWVKVHNASLIDRDRLYILLKEKQEYLQHLRVLESVSHNPDRELKIEKIKDEIHDIQYQIMKEK